MFLNIKTNMNEEANDCGLLTEEWNRLVDVLESQWQSESLSKTGNQLSRKSSTKINSVLFHTTYNQSHENEVATSCDEYTQFPSSNLISSMPCSIEKDCEIIVLNSDIIQKPEICPLEVTLVNPPNAVDIKLTSSSRSKVNYNIESESNQQNIPPGNRSMMKNNETLQRNDANPSQKRKVDEDFTQSTQKTKKKPVDDMSLEWSPYFERTEVWKQVELIERQHLEAKNMIPSNNVRKLNFKRVQSEKSLIRSMKPFQRHNSGHF